jgi:ubiquinone/menaquinone biosynthesis C-methylase UbiE
LLKSDQTCLSLRHIFDDSTGYERSMAPWSRAAGKVFLDWLDVPINARWLDVGCGTGTFTRLIHARCSPAFVVAVDPAVTQVEHAAAHPLPSSYFGVGDAQALPFADHTFDVAVAALVFNFVPNAPQAIEELYRVTVPGGVVGGYVWDFAGELSPTWPLRAGLREIGVDVPAVPGTQHSNAASLAALFEPNFTTVSACSIEAVVRFRDFADYWGCQMAVANPLTRVVGALTASQCMKLKTSVRRKVQQRSGEVSYAAYANAIKGVVQSSSS